MISGRVDRASSTKTVDSGSIAARVKPKIIKVGIHTVSLLDVQHLKGQCEASTVYVADRWADGSLTRRLKGPFAVSDQGILVNKMLLQL